MKKVIHVVSSFILLISLIFPQQELPVITEIKYQILSDTLKITTQPQIISVTIINESNEKITALKLGCEKLNMYWTLIQASLNGENLWLVQSEFSPVQKNILAWKYDQANHQLILYQENFSDPTNLELKIQLNLTGNSLSKKEFDDNIILEAITLTGVYNCNSINGNKIYFK
jgi:hypothetical protein